jgi:hypothetical protein
MVCNSFIAEIAKIDFDAQLNDGVILPKLAVSINQIQVPGQMVRLGLLPHFSGLLPGPGNGTL